MLVDVRGCYVTSFSDHFVFFGILMWLVPMLAEQVNV
jgi:hypothetical protein